MSANIDEVDHRTVPGRRIEELLTMKEGRRAFDDSLDIPLNALLPVTLGRSSESEYAWRPRKRGVNP
jgi:hypothetical protein